MVTAGINLLQDKSLSRKLAIDILYLLIQYDEAGIDIGPL